MRALIVIGTRPEAIKLAPIVYKLNQQTGIETIVCLTAQQREMVDQTLAVFGIEPDIDLDLMSANQSLSTIAAKVLSSLDSVLQEYNPDVIIVQGDTTTALCGALAGFYSKIKVAHVEAGLRTGDKFSPYPEEINRGLIGKLADYHFSPTQTSRENLLREGVKETDIQVSGNTVIDSLLLVREILEQQGYWPKALTEKLDSNKRIVLVTGHRRENMGGPVQNICGAIKAVANERSDVQFVYPVHLNPNIREPVRENLSGIENVHLIDPLNYRDFVWLLNRCDIVLTDSGGIQEEAPTFGKPVLVMRETTERPEGIESGNAILVGSSKERITNSLLQLISDDGEYKKMSEKANPYGDGKSAQRIAEYLMSVLTKNNENQIVELAA